MLQIIKNLTHTLSLFDIPYKRFGKSMTVVRIKCLAASNSDVECFRVVISVKRQKPQVTYDKCQYFPFNLPCICLENKGEFHIMSGVI